MNSKKKQDTWSKEAGYIWSMIGSAVGFANVLSFSALCYKNGGGAFLIPYVIAHLVVGIPLLLLEGVVGQRTRLPLVSAMGELVGRRAKLLGWFAILTCATIGGFYLVLTSYSVAYAYFSAKGFAAIDAGYFFKTVFLRDSGSLSKVGGVAIGALLSTIIVAGFTWAVLIRNIRSGIEKLCTIFLPLLGILMGLFSLAVFLLPGAGEGLKHYLIPDFSRLGNWTLWRDVFGQVFFSLSLGLGIVTGYSRHNHESFSITRSMYKIAAGDFLISFISGFAIFGCMGFMSQSSGMAFSQLVSSDSAFEIGFVIFPMILNQFGELLSRIIGPIFFFCVFIAGITGVFSIVESVAGNIEVEFNKNRKTAVSWALALIMVLALPFCLGNGQQLLGAMAPMVLGNAILVGGIGEIVLFLMISKTIRDEAIWFNGKRRIYSYHCLKWVVLPLLSSSLLGALYHELRSGFAIEGVVRLSWLVVVLGAGVILSRRSVSSIQMAKLAE
ncbi:MAG: sodium-dependent transporter [Chlamydiales bacterium]